MTTRKTIGCELDRGTVKLFGLLMTSNPSSSEAHGAKCRTSASEPKGMAKKPPDSGRPRSCS
jgi:hypothetical protein